MSKKIDFNAFDNVCKSNATAKSNAGKKQSIYNEVTFLHFAKNNFPQSFDGANVIPSKREKLFKDTRKKIRVMFFNLLENIERANKNNNKNLLAESAKNFATFYNAMYQINDYSVASVSSANMSAENREYIAKILPIAQKAMQPKKENKKVATKATKANESANVIAENSEK